MTITKEALSNKAKFIGLHAALGGIAGAGIGHDLTSKRKNLKRNTLVGAGIGAIGGGLHGSRGWKTINRPKSGGKYHDPYAEAHSSQAKQRRQKRRDSGGKPQNPGFASGTSFDKIKDPRTRVKAEAMARGAKSAGTPAEQAAYKRNLAGLGKKHGFSPEDLMKHAAFEAGMIAALEACRE